MDQKMGVAREINGMLNTLFPEGVITEVAAPWMWRAEPTLAERVIVRNAVDKRRREFVAGRTCARSILGRLGFDGELTIGKNGHGAPLWPEGIVGSISHTDEVCIVSISRRKPELKSLGVDVEKDTGLDPDLVDLVCDRLEKEACFNARVADPYVLAKVIFSAKESVYKCLYPVTGVVMDFHDIHIQPDFLEQKFLGTIAGGFHGDAVEGVCSGRILYHAGYIYTSCTLSVPGGISHEGAAFNHCSGT